MADPGFPVGGADLRHGRFSAETYAKTKELCPVGRGGVGGGAPPGFATVILVLPSSFSQHEANT